LFLLLLQPTLPIVTSRSDGVTPRVVHSSGHISYKPLPLSGLCSPPVVPSIEGLHADGLYALAPLAARGFFFFFDTLSFPFLPRTISLPLIACPFLNHRTLPRPPFPGNRHVPNSCYSVHSPPARLPIFVHDPLFARVTISFLWWQKLFLSFW